MTLDEFRRHPAYDYYIITLVSDCLVCDLETKFDNQYTIIYMKRPNIKKQTKSLINKKALAKIIERSNICKHAIKELKLAGYGKGDGGPNDWIYQQVLEAVAVFASHDNSGISAPWEINLVQRLCNWNIISPLTFKLEENIKLIQIK